MRGSGPRDAGSNPARAITIGLSLFILLIKMREDIKQILIKHKYKLIGNHSAVKICHWTREMILNKRPCYKSKFYGIQSHRCIQMTPSVSWCQHSCLYCWRPVEYTQNIYIDVPLDSPEFIVEESIKKQREIVMNFKHKLEQGLIDRRIFEEALNPKHAAISLAGEPTNYPYISDLIEEYHKRNMTTFLVTNGMNPKRLEEVKPTQLYISLTSFDEKSYEKIHRPRIKNGWKLLLKSLEIFSNRKDLRRVIRITVIKNFNLEHPDKFIKLLQLAEPDFIECKSYMRVGFSQYRLEKQNVPTFDEVYKFSERISEELGYKIEDYSKESKAILLSSGRINRFIRC